jgi:hypothetical protein
MFIVSCICRSPWTRRDSRDAGESSRSPGLFLQHGNEPGAARPHAEGQGEHIRRVNHRRVLGMLAGEGIVMASHQMSDGLGNAPFSKQELS